MIWHPFSLAIVMVDALALLFVVKAAATSVRVAADWSPGSSTKQQITLETAAETGAMSARAAFGLLIGSTLVLVVAVTNVFPGIVPGAMCGTVVLQATGGNGTQAFMFKLLCLGIFYLWYILDRLDRTSPDAPLARMNAKMLLLAAPFAILAVFATFNTLNTLNSLDAHTPVDCCAVVYDQFTGTRGVAHARGPSDHQLVWSFGILTFLLICLGSVGVFWRKKRSGLISGTAAIFSLAWGTISALFLVRVLSAYTYEVLHHHCPWCLFLPEHHYVGFALFGLLGLAVIQAPTAYVCHWAGLAHPGLAEKSDRLARRSLAAMIFFILVFTVAAAGPAISWRMRYGVWMS